jgi:hypothetical protein
MCCSNHQCIRDSKRIVHTISGHAGPGGGASIDGQQEGVLASVVEAAVQTPGTSAEPNQASRRPAKQASSEPASQQGPGEQLEDSSPESAGGDGVLEGVPIVVDSGDLKEYIGQPPFTSDRIYDSTPAGVVMGLAWWGPAPWLCLQPAYVSGIHLLRLWLLWMT